MLDYKRAVPFTMFTGGVGRHAQGKLPIAKDYMGDPSSKTVSDLLEHISYTTLSHNIREIWITY